MLLFAKTGIPDIMRGGVQKAQAVGKERVQNRDTLHPGSMSGAKLMPFISTVKPDLAYPVDLWIDETTATPLRLHVTEPDSTGWQIELFGTTNPLTSRRRSSHQRLASLRPECRERSATPRSSSRSSASRFIGALDLTIILAVLPEVIRSLTIEIQKLDVAGWVVTGYFVSYAVSMTHGEGVGPAGGASCISPAW